MTSNTIPVGDGKIELHTARLRLRGAVSSDAEHLYETFKDPEVMRYWSELPHKSLDRTRDWISNMMKGEYNGVADFVICLKPNDLPIGKIGVWSVDEIGFLLSRSQWHKGLAKEALAAIIPYLLGERKLDSISADADPRNDASIGILKRFGFEEQKLEKHTFEIDGVWVDSLYLRLMKDRWDAVNTS